MSRPATVVAVWTGPLHKILDSEVRWQRPQAMQAIEAALDAGALVQAYVDHPLSPEEEAELERDSDPALALWHQAVALCAPGQDAADLLLAAAHRRGGL